MLHELRNERLERGPNIVLDRMRKMNGRRICNGFEGRKRAEGGGVGVFWLQSKRNASKVCMLVVFVVGVIYILLPRPASSF